MLDAKSIGILMSFGGILDGLLRGLRTNPDTEAGLVTNTQRVHLVESSHKPNLEAR